MTYDEVTKRLREQESLLREYNVEIRNAERSIEDAASTIDSLRNSRDTRVEKKKQETLARGSAKVAKPYEEKIRDYNQKKDKLREVLDRGLAKYTFDSCSVPYKEDLNLVLGATNNLEGIHSLCDDILGHNFTERIYNSFEFTKIEIDDLSGLLEDVAKYKTGLSLIQQMSGYKFMNTMENLLVKYNPCSGDIRLNKIAIYAGMCFLLVFISIIFLSPVFLSVLLLLGVANLCKNYYIYKVLYTIKLISDNTEKITEEINSKIQSEVDAKHAEMTRAYDKRVNVLNERISDTRTKMTASVTKFQDEFKFDDREIIRDINESISNQNINLDRLKKSRNEYQTNADKCKSEIAKLQAELNNMGEQVIKDYTKLEHGTNYLFPEKVLIDTKDGKPVFWEHPKGSCLFVCDSEPQDSLKFIRLFCLQLLNRMNPFAYNVTYMDVKELATEMQAFQPLTRVGVFNLVINSEEVKNTIRDCAADLRRRIVLIRREYEDITQYNEAMLSMESVTESYSFIILPNIIEDAVKLSDFRSLIYKGSDVGVYVMQFTSYQELRDMGDQALEFIERFDNTYIFKPCEINKKGKMFFKSRIKAELE